SYDHIESVSVTDSSGPGDLSVSIAGSNEDDVFTVVGTGVNAYTVAISDGPTVQYTGSTSLTLQGLDGDDDFSITPVASWGVAVTVNGGDPTASDRLVVNGVPGVGEDLIY